MKIAIIGLGYVGLPLAIEFAKHFKVVGFDISKKRIDDLKKNIDINGETPCKNIIKVKNNLSFTNKKTCIQASDIIIIAVPTPISKNKKPDLSLVESASKIVGENMKREAIVVYESTVYPGCTEEVCLPILEKYSGMRLGEFSIGYSPERVNPGDKKHTIDKIYKIVAGYNKKTTNKLAEIYGKITHVYKASSIKVAEAAKIIENIQRDLNIALVNELSLIFQKMEIKTKDVLDAAATKWNFHRYHPGLVGGHCIGVDPYYMTHKALELGYNPRVILAGRRINDSMARQTAEMIIKELKNNKIKMEDAKILIMGVTFKENVKDLRNSKTEDVIKILNKNGISITVSDYMFREEEKLFGYLNTLNPKGKFDAIFIGALHKEFKKFGLKDFQKLLNNKGVVLDPESKLNQNLFHKTSYKMITL